MKRLESFNPQSPKEYWWSFYHEFEDEELALHLKNKVFEYIKNDLAEEGEPFAKALADASFYFNKDKASLLKDAIIHIDGIYEEIDAEIKNKNQHFQDIQGDVYEYLLKHTNEAGKNGQFRTPRHIINMMTEILKPDIDGKICDIACGSGGFLVGAYQYIITKYSKEITKDDDGLFKGTDAKKLSKSKKDKLKEDIFYGYDVDQTMVRIGVMNMMMHGITKPNIENVDSLSIRYEEVEAKRLDLLLDKKDNKTITNPKLQGQYKYILANPPFTGKINSVGVSENIDRVYPPKYDKNKKRIKQTVQSELLFIDRIIYMLEVGGKAAVIVPEGVLFNSGGAYKKTREILMTDCDLEGVISLPSGVFEPYTAVKTSILIIKKRKFKNGFDKPQAIKVWFYGMESDGYSLDKNRKRLKNEPLPLVIDRWNNKEKLEQHNTKLDYFNIPYEEIKANGFELNFNLYKEFVYKAPKFKSTEIIIKELHKLENEISKGLSELV
ncbi:SAM-dependent methyltransferase [Zobellia uliginosa]|nr:SAM-dependent methyltransferase [Zobellia uliginosa]